MASQKISEFNVSTSLTDNALFTFVINGTNKSVPFSTFKTNLGVWIENDTNTENLIGTQAILRIN